MAWWRTIINRQTMVTEAIEYTNDVLSDFEISYSIQTNATLIDEEWIQIFKEFDFSIGISLDGYKELHDQYRIAKNGQGTYETIITNIKSIKRVREYQLLY